MSETDPGCQTTDPDPVYSPSNNLDLGTDHRRPTHLAALTRHQHVVPVDSRTEQVLAN